MGKQVPNKKISNKQSKPQQYISIKGARVHNLKNISLDLPRNKLIVITGVSGSGKSSLAIDTIFAEGQRRYLESLSSYARQFLQRQSKPDVDQITGLSPAIAIDQKSLNSSPRSTVGTMTEIYNYLQLLFAKIGKVYSPKTGTEIRKYQVTDILNFILSHSSETPRQLLLCYPYAATNFNATKREQTLQTLSAKMITRARLNNGQIMRLEQIPANLNGDLWLIVDRVQVDISCEAELGARLRDSLEIAMFEGNERVILVFDETKIHEFSNHNQEEIEYIKPSESLFSFQTSLGACKNCLGTGQAYYYDYNLVIPNPKLSIAAGAIAPWNSHKMSKYLQQLISLAPKLKIPIHRPIQQLNSEQIDLLWRGNDLFPGILGVFRLWEREQYKIQYRSLLARYKRYGICQECKGSRLRQEALYVKVAGKNIAQVIEMRIDKLHYWLENLDLTTSERQICARLCQEILQRTRTLCQVGLSYLTLNRGASSLSGGETQRVRLTLSLGNALNDTIYILDEPSIGLHPRDTERLLEVIRNLCALNNTVIVIEHDDAIMRAADFIVDLGPFASHLGGEVIFAGSYSELLKAQNSLTASYLRGEKAKLPKKNKAKAQKFVQISGVQVNNLKNVQVKFPLYRFSVIAGVSGSGKSSLVTQALYPALRAVLQGQKPEFALEIDVPNAFNEVTLIDQNSIGASSRSTPISYIGAFKFIRELFAKQELSQELGYNTKHFSYNSNLGSCPNCEGSGCENIDMLFMADIQLPCEFCQGKRYKSEILEVQYKGKNIYEILQLSVAEALDFFREQRTICKYLQTLEEVGLGYMRLGQSANTMSGGEIQRVKLASYLNLGQNSRELLIFDEPTTGLHFHDIHKLLRTFDKLTELGHTILCIEHNPMLIQAADWIIELGPGAAENGGKIIYAGDLQGIFKQKNSLITKYL